MRAFRRGERVEAGGGTCAEALARPGVDRGPGGDVPTGCGHPQFPYKKQRRHLQRAAGIETTSFCFCRNLALPPDARGFGTFSVFLIKFFHAPACFVFTRRPVGSVFFRKKFFVASRPFTRRRAPPPPPGATRPAFKNFWLRLWPNTLFDLSAVLAHGAVSARSAPYDRE